MRDLYLQEAVDVIEIDDRLPIGGTGACTNYNGYEFYSKYTYFSFINNQTTPCFEDDKIKEYMSNKTANNSCLC